MGTSYVDPRQRFSDPEEVLRVALASLQVRLWTALPGIIVSFDAEKITASVQPAIQGAQLAADGSTKFVNLPVLLDVPVIFPRGGGCTFTFPIYPGGGDECLVIFSARCIDVWHQQGGVQPPYEPRLHDLSDGFAIVGPFSQATKISNVSTTEAQLRSDDGSTTVSLDPTGQIVSIVAPGGVNINAPTVAIIGALTVTQTIAAQHNITSDTDVKAQTVSLHGHIHAGVTAGGANTAPPTP